MPLGPSSESFAMPALFDPINVVLLAAAVFIAWRFFAVLGQRNGTGDKRPGINLPRVEKPPAPAQGQGDAISSEPPEILAPVWKGFAEEGTPLAIGLETLAAASPGFLVPSFLAGAKQAYEMILDAYAKGDRQTLKPLLSKEVMDGFSSAINSRERAGERMVFQFVGVKSAAVTQAQVEGKRAQLTVLFKGEMITATLASDGTVKEGDAKLIREVIDEWTFERDVASRDPNWKLVGTADGGI